MQNVDKHIIDLKFIPEIAPIVFKYISQKDLRNYAATTTKELLLVIESEVSITKISETFFLNFLNDNKIKTDNIKRELEKNIYALSEYVFDVEAIKIRRYVKISEFLSELSDESIQLLKNVKIKPESQYQKLISGIKTKKETDNIDNIGYLLAFGLFKKVLNFDENKHIGVGYPKKIVTFTCGILEGHRQNYVLINSPFLTKIQRQIIIRDVFNKSVFKKYNFSSAKSEIEIYNSEINCTQGKNRLYHKDDILLFLKHTKSECESEIDACKAVFLQGLIDFYPGLEFSFNLFRIGQEINDREDAKKQDAIAIKATRKFLLEEKPKKAYICVKSIQDKDKKKHFLAIVFDRAQSCQDIKLFNQILSENESFEVTHTSNQSLSILPLNEKVAPSGINVFPKMCSYNLQIVQNSLSRNDLVDAIKYILEMSSGSDKAIAKTYILDFIINKANHMDIPELAECASQLKNTKNIIDWDELYFLLSRQDVNKAFDYYTLIKKKEKYRDIFNFFDSLLSDYLKDHQISSALDYIFIAKSAEERLILFQMAKTLFPEISDFKTFDYAMKISNDSEIKTFLESYFSSMKQYVDKNFTEALDIAEKVKNSKHRKELYKCLARGLDEESINIVNDIEDDAERRELRLAIFDK